jgi:hypothetical protein
MPKQFAVQERIGSFVPDFILFLAIFAIPPKGNRQD